MTNLADVVDVIVVDFDGTICESANVKTDAFFQLYLDEQGEEFATTVRDYHLEFAGVSRGDKIKHVEEQMLGRPGRDERMHLVADGFGDIVRDKVIASALIPGVAPFFEKHGGEVPMLVASATPTAYLRQIMKERGIESWFEEVEGSPALKGEIVKGFLPRRGVSQERAIMVGDQTPAIDHFDGLAEAIVAVASGGN